MKQYPSIVGASKAPREHCVAFYKYDGSNLRFCWQRKRGWTKYGTRTQMFDKTHEIYGNAIQLFHDTIEPFIMPILQKQWRDSQEFIVFCEYFGKNSFAGTHVDNEPKQLKLFDVNVYKKGIISPYDFVKYFGHIDCAAEVIYEGILNKSFIGNVREGKYPVFEGVVCKGGSGHNLWMAKIKTNAYREKLKMVYSGDWEKYWE